MGTENFQIFKLYIKIFHAVTESNTVFLSISVKREICVSVSYISGHICILETQIHGAWKKKKLKYTNVLIIFQHSPQTAFVLSSANTGTSWRVTDVLIKARCCGIQCTDELYARTAASSTAWALIKHKSPDQTSKEGAKCSFRNVCKSHCRLSTAPKCERQKENVSFLWQ